MAFSKNRRLADLITANAEQFITSAHVTDAAIVPGDLHATLDLTGKTITVANASTGDSDTTVANTAFVQQEIAALVDSSPGTLNTLNELAAALGDDANFSTTVTNSIATKLPLAGGSMTGALNITLADNNPQLTLISTDADANTGPILKLYRNSASPADDDALGRIQWSGEDDAGNDSTFARIDVVATDVSNGSEDARMEFSPAVSDGFTPTMSLTGGKVGIGTTSPSALLNVNTGSSGSHDAIIISRTTHGTVGTLKNAAGSLQVLSNKQLVLGADPTNSFTAAGSEILFQTDGTTKMILSSGGNVGIGDTDPFTKLHVENTGWSSGAPYGAVASITGNNVNDNNWGHLIVTDSSTANGNGGSIRFATGTADASNLNPFAGIQGVAEGTSYGGLGLYTRPSGGSATERMHIDSSGRVGINRIPAISNSKLEVGGADNVPLINVEASGATAGVGIGSSRMKFYYGTAEKASIDSSGNLRTARQIIQENSDGTPRFINIPYSSAGSGFTFNWDDLANHSAVGDQSSETNAFMFEVNVTSYLFRRVKALIIVDTNSTNSIAVHTIHSSTLTCSASIPTGSESITITIGGLWGNAVNYMGRITTF